MLHVGAYITTLMGMLHMGIIVVHNLCHLAMTDKSMEPAYESSLRTVCEIAVLRHYAQFTGTHGGYGFYSPEVGSSYHSQFRVQDANNGILQTLSDPGLANTASKIRYSSLLDVQHGWLDSMGTGQPQQLAEALAITLTKAVAKRHRQYSVRSRFTVLRVPRLAELKQDPTLLSTHYLLLTK